jgi:hypothetical protein
MSTARDILQKDKPLREWWDAIAHHDNFAKIVMVARSELMDKSSCDSIYLQGAKDFEKQLLSIASLPPPPREQLSSGIKHDIDLTRKPKDKAAKKE